MSSNIHLKQVAFDRAIRLGNSTVQGAATEGVEACDMYYDPAAELVYLKHKARKTVTLVPKSNVTFMVPFSFDYADE